MGKDGEGWYYFGARYYDSEIGKWTAVDPMQQYYDSYLYGGNNPVNRIDPDGNADRPAIPINPQGIIRRYQAKATELTANYIKGWVKGAAVVGGTGTVVAAGVLGGPGAAKVTGDVALATANVVLSNPAATTTTIATAIDVGDAVLGPPDPSDKGLTGFKQVFLGISTFFQRLFSSGNE